MEAKMPILVNISTCCSGQRLLQYSGRPSPSLAVLVGLEVVVVVVVVVGLSFDKSSWELLSPAPPLSCEGVSDDWEVVTFTASTCWTGETLITATIK